jgi:hypothetical protein
MAIPPPPPCTILNSLFIAKALDPGAGLNGDNYLAGAGASSCCSEFVVLFPIEELRACDWHSRFVCGF